MNLDNISVGDSLLIPVIVKSIDSNGRHFDSIEVELNSPEDETPRRTIKLEARNLMTSNSPSLLAAVTQKATFVSQNFTLSGCHLISRLPVEMFLGLEQVQVIVLDDLYITTLPRGIFDCIKDLTGSLEIASNSKLVSIPYGLFDRLALFNDVGIFNNPLFTSIPSGIFDHNPLLVAVYLSGNALTELSIKNALTSLVVSGAINGTVDVSGGTNATHATWTTPTLAAETTLVGRGWTVTA